MPDTRHDDAATDDVPEDSTEAASPNDATDTADAGESQPDDEHRARRIILRVAAGLALIAVLGAVGYGGWQYKQLVDVSAASRSALAAARDYGVTLTSVDSKDIDANTARVLDGATGDFKDMYGRSADQLRQVLIDNDASATGTVIDAGVKSATKDTVEVLMFVDQSVTNSANPKPRLDRNRVAMTMSLVDGRWLAAKVDVF